MHLQRGVYVGLFPVPHSPTRFGEAEVTISETEVRFRYATGRGVHCETLFLAGFKAMPEAQALSLVVTEENPVDCEVSGHLHSSGSPVMVFVRERSSGVTALFVFRPDAQSPLFPPAMYDAKSLACFTRALRELEGESRAGQTPRLYNGGYSPAAHARN